MAWKRAKMQVDKCIQGLQMWNQCSKWEKTAKERRVTNRKGRNKAKGLHYTQARTFRQTEITLPIKKVTASIVERFMRQDLKWLRIVNLLCKLNLNLPIG